MNLVNFFLLFFGKNSCDGYGIRSMGTNFERVVASMVGRLSQQLSKSLPAAYLVGLTYIKIFYPTVDILGGGSRFPADYFGFGCRENCERRKRRNVSSSSFAKFVEH